MRKFILLFVSAAFAAASCSINPEKKIASIYDCWSNDTTLGATSIRMGNLLSDRSGSDSDAIDFFTLMVSKQAGTEDIFTVTADSTGSLNLEADIIVKGKKASGKTILISAPIDSWADTCGTVHDNLDGCLAAVNVFSSIKKLRIRGANNVRLLLYQSCKGSLEGLRTAYREYERKGDEILFQIDLRSEGDIHNTFRIGETGLIYNEFIKVIPPYFAPYGEYSFEEVPAIESSWPVKASHYSYTVHRESLGKDIAAVTSLLFLLD